MAGWFYLPVRIALLGWQAGNCGSIYPQRKEAVVRRVADAIFTESPYGGFDPSGWPDDLQGWGSDHPVLLQAIDTFEPRKILEIGSWKGRSAINMARHARDKGLDCEVVCVDTWLGSSEHWLREKPEWYEWLQIKFGRPQLYNTFLANVVRAGLQNSITPFPCTSETASVVLIKLGFYFDICYVDAAHEYDAVKRDLAAVWPLCREPGVLIGDDYDWDSVKRAVDEFAREMGVAVRKDAEKYVIVKGRHPFPE